MNHPSHEQLVDFLDGELTEPLQFEIEQHVKSCDECGAIVNSWRGVRSQLAAWKLAERAPVRATTGRAALQQNLLRIAAAIALLVTGYALARISSPAQPDMNQFRTELAQQIRGELRSELQTELATFAESYVTEQRAQQQAFVQTVHELDAGWLAALGRLRNDIETVAVRTQEEFARLASSAP